MHSTVREQVQSVEENVMTTQYLDVSIPLFEGQVQWDKVLLRRDA